MSADVPGRQNLPDAELLSHEISKADKWAEETAKQAEWVRSREKAGLARGQWPGGGRRVGSSGQWALLELSRKSSIARLCARKWAGGAQGPSAHFKVGMAKVPSTVGRRQHGAVHGHNRIGYSGHKASRAPWKAVSTVHEGLGQAVSGLPHEEGYR